jgi:threonine/homoserine/homoserine lactone efflux protein
LTDRTAFRQGLVSNLGNPKIAIFFSSLLPQFVGGDGASFSALLALGLLFCALGLIWLTSYAVILDRAGAYLRRSTVRRAIEAVTGFVLIGLAVRLATARR